MIISLMHIWETWACGEILTTQRMLREEVDMVGDDHNVANLKGGIHTTGSIRDEQRLDAQLIHHTDREGHILHGIAFIKMESALHGKDIDTT